jgi:excisionase family DNA binding protein
MANDREPTQDWLTVGEAARVLGVSDEAVRQKAKRRTLRSMKGNDGRLRVLIDTSSTQDQPTGDRPKTNQDNTGEINALQEHVQTLREQLEQQRADHVAERERLNLEIDRGRLNVERIRGELDRERDHARDLADRLDMAHREHGNEAAQLRQQIDGLRTELARPWWRRLIGR